MGLMSMESTEVKGAMSEMTVEKKAVSHTILNLMIIASTQYI